MILNGFFNFSLFCVIPTFPHNYNANTVKLYCLLFIIVIYSLCCFELCYFRLAFRIILLRTSFLLYNSFCIVLLILTIQRMFK